MNSRVGSIGQNRAKRGTHTLRHTEAILIHRRTKHLPVVQPLLGHTRLESTVRYLGIEVDEPAQIAEQTSVQRPRSLEVPASTDGREPANCGHHSTWLARMSTRPILPNGCFDLQATAQPDPEETFVEACVNVWSSAWPGARPMLYSPLSCAGPDTLDAEISGRWFYRPAKAVQTHAVMIRADP